MPFGAAGEASAEFQHSLNCDATQTENNLRQNFQFLDNLASV